MRFLRFMRLLPSIGLLVLAASAAPSPTASAGTDEALSYEYIAFPGCPIRGEANFYDICHDQMAVLAFGLDEAKARGKLLMVVFGGTWCPSCKALHRMLPGPEVLAYKGDGFDYSRFDVTEIGISALYGGRIVPVPSGKALLDSIPGAKLRAVPFLAFIDPVSLQVWTRNTDDLEMASGEDRIVDPAKIRGIMRSAYLWLREGKNPDEEPGWLRRKLDRWLGRS